MRKCTKCSEEKESNLQNFYWIGSRDRFEAQCKECRTSRFKELKALNIKRPSKNRKPRKDKKSDEYKKAWLKNWRALNKEKIRKQRHEQYHRFSERENLRTRKWRKDNPEKFKESWKKSDAKDKSKRRARKIVNYHLEKGNLVKPKECERCNSQKNIQAHHDDYTAPLNIKWLCSLCHGLLHRKNEGL